MNVKVNGDPREVPEGETLRALVERYNLKPEKVAIELNRRLARAEKYDLPLNDGDEVEIVTFVGGGEAVAGAARSDPSAPPGVTARLVVGPDLLVNLLHDRSAAGRFGAMEATLGVVVMSFLGFAIVVVGAAVIANTWIANYPRVGDAARIALTVCWLPVACLEWRSFHFYLEALSQASHPLPVGVAVRQAPRNLLVRLAAALWWGSHAVAAVVLSHWFVGHVRFTNPTPLEWTIQFVTPLVVMFGAAAVAMNTHLLIAVFALTRSERLVRSIWSARILLDLAVVFLVPTIHTNFLNPA